MSKHRSLLNKYLPYHHSETRSLSSGEVTLLLAMHDVEGMRATAGLPSSLVLYFTNSSINSRTALSACMEAMADKVRERQAPPKLIVTPCADYYGRNSRFESPGTDPIITRGTARRTASPPDWQHASCRQGTGRSIQIPP
jgi:hypothetical protein